MLICGIDEAGRGPVAGPVYAGAVILPETYELPGLNDSKQLTAARRRALYPEIRRQAVSWGIGRAEVAEIQSLNILNAAKLAMRRAVEALSVTPDALWIDGNSLIDSDIPSTAVVGGDKLHPCISAASILAKTARDEYMEQAGRVYPVYGFERHKGYGTEFHARAIEVHGVCPEHRTLFVETLLRNRAGQGANRAGQGANRAGAGGEALALEYLQARGFRLLDRNYHSRYGEIDIIAEDGRYLIFAEVKARRSQTFLSGAESVVPAKRRKIIRTARLWLTEHPTPLQPRFDVVQVTLSDPPGVKHIPNAFDSEGNP